MDFIKIHDKKLKIALDASELSRLGLAVSELDYKNVETKRALWQMLGDAKRKCGFDASGESLYVEVYPSRSGGCEIFVTCLSCEKKALRRAFPISFDDSESMIAASAALLTAGYRERSFLYRLCGRFYLITFSEDAGDTPLFVSLLGEFGREENESVYDVLKREGQLLSENAVETFGKMVLHRSSERKSEC